MDEYLADDEEPMVKKDESSISSEQGPKADDYVETRKCCKVFSYKCLFIAMGIVLIIDFFIELIMKLFDISQNENFDKLYFDVYLTLIVIYSVSLCLYLVYLIAPDGPKTRMLLPWALIIAVVANILFITWIIVYINCIY